MKMLIALGIMAIVFTSCGTLTHQETQQEQERLIAAYDAARQKHNPERVKEAVKHLLIGKWQYMELEVEEGSIQTAQMAPPTNNKAMPQQAPTSSTPAAEGHAKGAPGEQATPPTASEQLASPNSSNPEGNEQTPEKKATRLPAIEVIDEKSNQRILSAKAALVASTRQNLMLEFSEARSSYYYSGSNRGTNVTGQCYITTKRYGDEPFPFISFNRRTGPEMLEFIFGSEPIKQMVAKKKQADVERRRRMGGQIGRRVSAKTSYAIASLAGITVTEDKLYLVLYGDMKLTPKGWTRTGGLRCTFKRTE